MEEFNILLRRVTNILAMVTLPATIGLYMLAPEVITIISGDGFLKGVSSLRLLCPALLVSVFSWILAYCILLPAKRESKFFIAAAVSATVNIILNFVLIPFLSENGAALTTSIAEVLMLFLIIYYSRDILTGVYLKEFWKDILTYFLGTVTVGLLCVIVSGWSKSLIIQLILAVGISIVVYGLLLIVFKNKFCIEIIKKIKGDN
ncbi:hypothetical protein Si009_01362 [Streptococcus infantarius subsp. infantarius]|nr:hypothetical protein [Streptococcus infantarius subsp. infantarius]